MKTTRSGYLNRRAFFTAGTAVIGASLVGCLGRGFTVAHLSDKIATETIQDSFAASTVHTIQVLNAVGDVTITGAKTDTVDVAVRKRSSRGQSGLADIDVSITRTDGALSVETMIDKDATWFSTESPTTDVTITVPEGTSGPAITSVNSELGNVTLLNTHGDTVVRTNLGDVSASGVDGYLSLHSELGTILASNVTGLDHAHTRLGDLKVELLDLRGDVDISTKLGEVVVGVAADLDLDLLVEATASIDSTLLLRESQTGDGRLTGRQNRGGYHVHVVSELGDVSLRSIQRSA